MTFDPDALPKLVAEADACFRDCHDRSCSRMGHCTGGPGRAVDGWHHDRKRYDAEEARYREFKRWMDRWHEELAGDIDARDARQREATAAAREAALDEAVRAVHDAGGDNALYHADAIRALRAGDAARPASALPGYSEGWHAGFDAAVERDEELRKAIAAARSAAMSAVAHVAAANYSEREREAKASVRDAFDAVEKIVRAAP